MTSSLMVSGRIFSGELVDHLRHLCGQQPAPTVDAVARVACERLDWRSAHGRWALSSCKVALRKLHRRGLMAWPARACPRGARQLRGSGQALPPVHGVPERVDHVRGLRLRLLSGAADPLSPLWNDLMIAQHPCGAAPLVGTQLRYLIESEHGCLGAVGFGPAAWLLGARDEWIGWSSAARKANLGQVVDLSRLLIRREVRCANLASKVLSLALSCLGRDWPARYEVTPRLVETFIDRTSFTGRCFQAANWQRLGSSTGRGRLGSGPPAKSIKDIYVFGLHPQARRHLQHEPPRPVSPRALPADLASGSWWADEFAGLDLGDERLERRASRILAARAACPAATFCGSFGDRHQSKRAYAFIAHPDPALTLERLLAPHAEATLSRAATVPVVLLPQDSTSLNYSGLRQTTGLGPINQDGSRGLLLHALLAWQPDGVPLGVLNVQCWARAEAPPADPRSRNAKSVDQKESKVWTNALRVAAAAARRVPGTRFVTLADRGGDLFELHDLVQAGPPNLHAIVRAQHDRYLESHQRLWAAMAAQPLGRRLSLDVPRHHGQGARTATVELRWAAVTISPPRGCAKSTWPALPLSAVWVHEPAPPAGVAPLDWMLLTDLPLADGDAAWQIVQWYRRRWGNEEWHRVLKSACGAERREFTTALHLQRALAFELILAWRLLLLVKLGRARPDLPASTCFEADELAVLQRSKKTPSPAAPDAATGDSPGRGAGRLAGRA